MDDEPKPQRKVGVYDRPASADTRPKYLKVAIVLLAIIIVVWLVWSRTA
jgi:hypothetical protein